MNTVVDTSVMVKWITAWGESGLDEAAELLQRQRAGTTTLIAPGSARVELANTLRYVGIDEDDAEWFFNDIEDTGIRFVADSHDRVHQAVALSFAHKITVYDALFLALAKEFDCELVTADRRAFGRVPSDVARIRLVL